MKAELEKLVALQKLDARIKQLKKATQTTSERRVGLEQEFEARAFEIRELQKKHDEANGEKQRFEKELSEAAEKLERAERNLKNAQNQKQYEAAMREKGTLQKQISDFETQVLEKTEAVDEAAKVLNDRSEEIASLETERSAHLSEFEAGVEREKSELESAEKNRETAFAALPKNLAGIYNRLVTRIRDGVAVSTLR